MKYFIFTILTIQLLACKSNVKSIKPEDFYAEIQTNNGVLVDVRTPEEYKEGYIDGAININFNSDNFMAEASKNLNKDANIYVYCLKGVRSENAVNKLNTLGFKNVVSLAGGIEAWQKANLPLIMPEQPISNNMTSNDVKSGLKKYTTLEFDSIIKSKKLVFVDFNATWCGPCKAMQPFVDKIKEGRASEVAVLSIDSDVNPELAVKYRIEALPTIMLFKRSKILHRTVGGKPEEELNELVNKYK
jgi:thioredoxin 1